MIRDDDLDALMRDWLEGEAPGPEPRRLLSATLDLTRSRTPRPAWLARLRGGGVGMSRGRTTGHPLVATPILLLVGLLAALAVAATAIVGARPARPLVEHGVFEPTGALVASYVEGRTVTILADGRVLIAGRVAGRPAGRAELYDPATGAFVATGDMARRRSFHTATRLLDGRVLIAGGNGDDGPEAIAELYDPVAGTFSPTGSMTSPRAFATATRLDDGRVLIAGGGPAANATATAELYDPATGTFTATGSMTEPRMSHTAARLLDGRVLVVGGLGQPIGEEVRSAELYDPSTGLWSLTGTPVSTGQTFFPWAPDSVLLPDGRVLLAGGSEGSVSGEAAPIASSGIDLYDPSTGTFAAAAPMTVGRIDPSITLLSDGRVLIAGGLTSEGAVPRKCCWGLQAPLRSAEVYDPGTDRSVETGSLGVGRRGHTGVLLADGDVLVVDGRGWTAGEARRETAERFHP